MYTQLEQLQYDRRWKDLTELQEHYADFRDFYADCSEELLGFVPSDLQFDIANFVSNGPLYCMVQAQRGQAKTTITGCYAVWCLIHDPTTRVLIVSAGTDMAKEISTWCIQILNHMDCLECLRCDTSHPGARCSVKAYDVHYMLKGPDKSPSIACIGITSTSQGKRADLLIADDVESQKNSMTEHMRQQLIHLTKDFTSINATGRIVYLGTPQSTDSIYNTLASRGYTIRIWPGRYPLAKDMESYGDHLAPLVHARLLADASLQQGGGPLGEIGQPTDLIMGSEEKLTRTQVDQGMAYFQLQYMLNTALMDADRYPLKCNHLMFYSFDNNECPGKFTWGNAPDLFVDVPTGLSLVKTRLYRPAKVHKEYFNYGEKIMSIDPAGGGQNGDETGVAILYECNGFIIVKHVTGIPGGTTPDKLCSIIELSDKFNVHRILVEKNYGNGAFAEALRGEAIRQGVRLEIEEVWSAGQKELRIIDALDPVIGSHRLLIDDAVLQHDVTSTQKYPLDSRMQYQFLFQLDKLTRDRGALIHDDRLEAVSQGVTYMLKSISKNADRAIEQKVERKNKEFMQDPFGVWRNRYKGNKAIPASGQGNAFARFRTH